MEILRFVLIGIEVICSLLLIGIILLQKSKSEGLGLAFGSGMGESIFGSRAGNVLTKATIVLAVVFMANTLGLAIVFSGVQSRSLMDSVTGGAEAPLPAGVGSERPREQQPRQRPQTAEGQVPTLPGATLDDSAPAPAPVAADAANDAQSPAE